MFALTSVLLATSLVGVAHADDKAIDGDLAKFQGEWTAMVGRDKNIPITIEIAKEKVTVKGTVNEQDFSVKGEVVLNDKANPKTIDWVKFTSPQGEEVKDNLGLYTLDGDTLTVCSGGPGNPRPTEIKAGEGGPPNLIVFTRRKVEPKPREEAPKGDVAALQGKWKALIGPNKDQSLVVTFKESKAEAKHTGENANEFEVKGEYTINESASPKTIDFVKLKGENGDEIGDNLGIYKIEGESLTICAGGPGGPRPTEFKAGDGGEQARLWTLTREKK